MNSFLKNFLGKSIRKGSLEIVGADGDRAVVGDGTGTPVRIRFTSAQAEKNVIFNPQLKLGEEFMDGGFVIEAGSIYDLVATLLSNIQNVHATWWMKGLGGLAFATRRIAQFNTPLRSRRNVHSHYDLDGRLYSLFLDNDLQYSCAYFEPDNTELEEAQVAKKRHLAAKLRLEPGMRVLDIGSGWGGLGLYLADRAKVDVTGVTLSDEQFAVSNRRAGEQGLTDRVRFLLQDYRKVQGPFDRIVSVGMFEHVGVGHFRAFFEACKGLLAPDGVMVLHSIGRFDGPGFTNSWIAKYIFPGGYIPALSEVLPSIEKTGLKVTDIEILRLHYAKTLRAWRERFLAHREQVAAMYDERFCRMWEFYLATSETAFQYQDMMNFQIQIAKDQHAVPFTRNYMVEAEEAYRALDRRAVARTPLKLAGE